MSASTSISMYQASIPVLVRMLDNLQGILAKAAAHAQARKIDDSVLLSLRMFPDMFPLSRQVQIATDAAKGCAARLAGAEIPRYEDTETSFAQLAERIDKTLAFVKSFNPAQIDGSEGREIVIKTPFGELRFSGLQFLLHFAIPNLHFHISTAYNLLRSNGVELGKRDFLGN
jgi:uncharacterized protein